MAIDAHEMPIADPSRFPLLLPRLRLIGLAIVLLSVPTASADDAAGRSADTGPVSRAELEEAEQTVFGWVFGPAANAASAHKSLDLLAQEKIVLIERICGLDDDQFEKLRLAARGDNQLTLDWIKGIASRYREGKDDSARVQELVREAHQLKRDLAAKLSDPLGTSKLFFKCLDTALTGQQREKYLPVRTIVHAGGLVQARLPSLGSGFEVVLTRSSITDDDLGQVSRMAGVVSLLLVETQVTDAGLVHLRGLARLQSLWLDKTRITGAGLSHLKGLKNLEYLLLAGTKVDDAGLVHLKDLPSLAQITLDGTPVTDAGLAHVKEIGSLRNLLLRNTRVTNAGLAHLRVLTELRGLTLDRTLVTDAGLAQLQDLSKLYSLSLNDTQVTDAGLERLQRLTSLQILELDGTPVTDAGLAHLQGLTALRRLSLRRTQLTDEAVADLRRDLPALKIDR